MLDILGEAALHSLLLAGVVQCALWLLRVRQAQLLLAIWTIVLLASIVMPMLLQFTPLHFPLDAALPEPLIDGAVNLVQQPYQQASSGNAVMEFPTQPLPGSWLQAFYVVVGCGMVLRVVLGVGLSFRMLARAVPIRPEWAAETHVRISRDVVGPVTIARVILLPIDVVDWSSETRQAVLAHERAHVARWDFALLIVSQLNRALFWFSPLSWWLHHRLVGLTELASDDQAIAFTRDRLGYAEILLEMGRRSGLVSRGSAMARPSTLPHRINRILLGQATSCCVSRPQQVLLMVGVAGLSLGVASLTPGPVSNPAPTLFTQQRGSQDYHAIGPILHDPNVGDPVEQSTAALQNPFQEEPSATTSPSFVTEAEPKPRSHPASASPAVPLDITAVQPPHTATLLLPRPAPWTLTKNTPVLSPSRVMGQPNQVSTGHGRWDNGLSLHALSTKKTPLHVAGGSDATATDVPANDEAFSSLPHKVAYGSLSASLRPDFEGITDSTCTGTVAIGSRAWLGQSWPGRQPEVIAGQTTPAQAQFFHKANGTLWVRFNAFGRPPLDLPVRFSRNGMTWTGEYGIAYTVQTSGGNHLAGLAALVASDSARLEFTCMKSTNHLF